MLAVYFNNPIFSVLKPLSSYTEALQIISRALLSDSLNSTGPLS